MHLISLQFFFKTHRRIFVVLVLAISLFLGSIQYSSAETSDVPTDSIGNIYDGVSGSVGSLLGNAETLLGDLVYAVALGIGGVVAGIGGVLLDQAFSQTIVNAGVYLSPSADVNNLNLGRGVQEMWGVVRDIFNILFIFGLIFIGIKTILDSEDSGTRKTLGLLIVAALMINFSLYITEVVVDFSNIAAVQVYNQISNVGFTETNSNTSNVVSLDRLLNAGHNSVTGAFMDVAQITSMFGPKPKTMDNFGITITYSIMMMVFLIVTGIVFAMGAILLISRFIALIIYMILSPLMFLGWILPNLASQQKKWWEGFLKQAFFAPAFLFMLYLSLMVLQRLKIGLGISGVNFTEIGSGKAIKADLFTLILFFVMMIGFLYASIKVAQMAGVAGASSSLKTLEGMGKWARGAAQSFAYRNTAGWGLNRVVKGIDALDRRAEGEPGNGRTAARLARGIIGGESTRRAVEKASNFGAGGMGREAVEKDEKTRSERAATGNAALDTKKKIQSGTRSGATVNERIAMEDALAKTSVSDLVKMAGSDSGLEALRAAAGSLTDKKFDSLMDNKDLTPKQKEAIGKARTESVKRNITGQLPTGATNAQKDAAFKKGLIGASADELNTLDFNELIEPGNIIYVQSGQLDKLESKWGDEKMRIFKKARKDQILSEFPIDPGKILTSRKGDKEIAKLPDEIFTGLNKDILLDELQTSNKLTGGLLQSIASETSMSGTDKKAFGLAVKGRFGAASPMTKDVEGFFKSAAGAAFGSYP